MNHNLKEMAALIADSQREFLKTCVDDCLSNRIMAFAVEDLYQRQEASARALIALSPERVPKLDCKAGCSFCCTQRVSATAFEVLGAVHYAASRLNDAEWDALGMKARATSEAVRAEGGNAEFSKPIECVFLHDGKCSVYEQRPLSCRSETSTDARACEIGFANPANPVQKGGDGITWAVASGFLSGLMSEIQDQNLDDLFYELNTAVAVAIEDQSAMERWLDGQVAFPGALSIPVS